MTNQDRAIQTLNEKIAELRTSESRLADTLWFLMGYIEGGHRGEDSSVMNRTHIHALNIAREEVKAKLDYYIKALISLTKERTEDAEQKA